MPQVETDDSGSGVGGQHLPSKEIPAAAPFCPFLVLKSWESVPLLSTWYQFPDKDVYPSGQVWWEMGSFIQCTPPCYLHI